MKIIKWSLPFKNTHYLNELTGLLAVNPFVMLVTAEVDSEQNVDSCNITVVNSEPEVVLSIGAAIGAHLVSYSLDMAEQQVEEQKNPLEDLFKAFAEQNEFEMMVQEAEEERGG